MAVRTVRLGPPTRFPGGVTNAAPDEATGSLPFPDPTLFITFVDDFIGHPPFDTTHWTHTSSSAGVTNAIADAIGGQVVVTNTDQDTHAAYYEWAAGETFTLESGKELWFKARFKCDDAADDVVNAAWFVGLHVTSATPLSAAQRALIVCPDGDATIFLQIDDNTTETNTSIGELEADTFTEIAFHYDGVSTIELFKDGVKVGEQTNVTNLPGSSNPLAVGFGVLNGEAVAKVMTVDYILCSEDRDVP